MKEFSVINYFLLWIFELTSSPTISFICCRQASSFAGSSILRSDVDEDVDEEVVETDNV
jgi:hypothetical protein